MALIQRKQEDYKKKPHQNGEVEKIHFFPFRKLSSSWQNPVLLESILEKCISSYPVIHAESLETQHGTHPTFIHHDLLVTPPSFLHSHLSPLALPLPLVLVQTLLIPI